MNQETLGKYTLVRHIATGGMAEIWLAEQSGPGGFNKELVIKRILPHLSQDKLFTGMFLDEARLVAQLTHPHIGQIFELGEIEGSYFIAMEYIDGVDLSKLIDKLREKGQPLAIELAVKMVSDVLVALDYAHEFSDRDGELLGLVHRDISPQNVLVSNDGAVKLVDFGVAKAADNSTKTQAGGVKGKFAYMAPEQIEGDPHLDRRVDVFAAGVLLYELLTFVKPFGDDLLAVSQILQTDAPDPRTYRPEIPEALVGIIYRALARDRNDRYQTAEAMLSDLEGFLFAHGIAVTARDLSVLVRQLRGLPTPRTTVRAVSAPGTSNTSQMPGRTTPSFGVNGTVVPQDVPGPRGGVGEYQTVAFEIESESKKQPLLIGGFLVIMVLIIGAFVTIGYLVISRDVDDGAGVVAVDDSTDGDKVKAGEKAKVPSVFRHSRNAREVFITTKPGTTIWYEGEKVGETSVQTLLRPGTYEVELRYEGTRRLESFEVETGKFINRVSF